MPQISAAYMSMSMPQISAADTSMPQIYVAYMRMTRVSTFENGRNEKIISLFWLEAISVPNMQHYYIHIIKS